MSDLENHAAKVQQDHVDRLDVPWDTPLVPRPFKRRPRPQTAIIARAARRKIQQREAKAAVDFWLATRPKTIGA